jgi:hypothetical protein
MSSEHDCCLFLIFTTNNLKFDLFLNSRRNVSKAIKLLELARCQAPLVQCIIISL